MPDGDVPVIAVDALVLIKLHANRPQDRADVAREAGADLDAIAAYLADQAPELLPRLDTTLG